MTQFDICVFGAGPSGSAIALCLAAMGYSVAIVEREISLRHQLGVSLPAGVSHWLTILGVKQDLAQAGFIPGGQSVILWEDAEPVVKESVNVFHGNKQILDQILLNEAVAAGVTLFQPCSSIVVAETASGQWTINLKLPSSEISFGARFIVEATGRRSLLKGTKSSYLPPVTCLYSYWNLPSGNTSFIEAGKSHWYWAAPFEENKMMVCVFADPHEIKQFASSSDFYLEKIKDFSLVNKHISRSTFSNVFACAATAYADEQPITSNYIKVGDAAFSTDPISSQGIQKALKTGVQGAIAVNTILSRPADTKLAIRYYRDMIQTEVKKNKRWTKQFYNTQGRYAPNEFWNERKGDEIQKPDEIILLSKESVLTISSGVVIKNVPVVSSSFIEERQGVFVEGNDEPFVFIQGFPVVALIEHLNGKTVIEALMLIKKLVPQTEPLQILKWMVYNRLIMESVHLSLY